MIRLCAPEDIDWLMEIAVECYPKFDVESSRSWLKQNMSKVIVARGEECAALAYVTAPFYSPSDYRFEVDFIVCRKTRFGATELLELLRFLNDFRKSKGFKNTKINSMLADIGPIVQRLGGHEAGKIWLIGD